MSVLLLSAGWIDPVPQGSSRSARAFWRVGVPRAIAVKGGRATFRLSTLGPTSQTLVVVSALSRDHGPFPIRLTARPATGAAIPEPADDGPRRAPRTDPMERHASRSTPAAEVPPVQPPTGERVFHLMVREGDPASPSNYTAVRGVLKGVGRRVQVYVGSEDLDRVTRATIGDIITTFDDRIYPSAGQQHAIARDVDGDGRFTILLSSWLNDLGGGRHAVDGFVRAADLDAAVPAPFGNRCDMMCLNAALRSGPYLRTVLAHEYMHAVVYTCKTLDHSDGRKLGPEEEGWLDEAIAHLAEDARGFTTSNIDYRVSAFLSSPERYQLIVDDYFAANLFRSHGNRGSTYLFLRWCVDQFGPELIPRLVRSPLRGIPNLEAATGATFADLYRRWSLAMFLSGLDPSNPVSDGSHDAYRSTDLRAPWADRELAGPRFRRVRPGAPADRWEARGTSSHYVLVDGDPAGVVEVEVEGPTEAELQVTALPMGEALARVGLSVCSDRGPDGRIRVLARVTEESGVPVRLSALAWEPLVPGPCPRAESARVGRLDMLGIAASFGTSALPARGELSSRPIPLPGVADETGPIVLKVLGTDPLGRRVAAWAELDPSQRVEAGAR